MRIPVVRGVIDRRILVNYHVRPEVLAALLPAPFRPRLVEGRGLVGIYLIRLKQVLPVWLPRWCGIESENAAHRIAVEWDDNGSVCEGVFVLRRDTDSRLNTLAGGRIFPGVHHHARFQVDETADRFAVAFQSDDGIAAVTVRGQRADRVPATSVFHSTAAASAFFQAGSLGYSPSSSPARWQGLELRCLNWQVEPLEIEVVRSSYCDDLAHFPHDSIEFDCALLMRGIEHEWHERTDLVCASPAPPITRCG